MNHGIVERQFGELANREHIVRGVMGFAPLKLKALMAHLEKNIRGSAWTSSAFVRSCISEIGISGNMGSFLLVC